MFANVKRPPVFNSSQLRNTYPLPSDSQVWFILVWHHVYNLAASAHGSSHLSSLVICPNLPKRKESCISLLGNGGPQFAACSPQRLL